MPGGGRRHTGAFVAGLWIHRGAQCLWHQRQGLFYLCCLLLLLYALMVLASPPGPDDWQPTISNPEALRDTLLRFANPPPSRDTGSNGNHDRRHRTETEVRAIIEDILGAPFPKSRPAWLVNPTTGRRLELDMYNEGKKLAFEYDGAQHSVYTPHFHVNEAHFEYRRLLDRLKTELCHKHGVRLVRISREDVRRDPGPSGVLRTVVRTLRQANPPLI